MPPLLISIVTVLKAGFVQLLTSCLGIAGDVVFRLPFNSFFHGAQTAGPLRPSTSVTYAYTRLETISRVVLLMKQFALDSSRGCPDDIDVREKTI